MFIAWASVRNVYAKRSIVALVLNACLMSFTPRRLCVAGSFAERKKLVTLTKRQSSLFFIFDLNSVFSLFMFTSVEAHINLCFFFFCFFVFFFFFRVAECSNRKT